MVTYYKCTHSKGDDMVKFILDDFKEVAYANTANGTTYVCPLMTNPEGKLAINIKKLGYDKSFILAPTNEDGVYIREFEVNEVSLNEFNPHKRKPKQIDIDEHAFDFLQFDEIVLLKYLIKKINEGYAEEFAANKAKSKGAPSDLRKIEKKLASKMCTKEGEK